MLHKYYQKVLGKVISFEKQPIMKNIRNENDSFLKFSPSKPTKDVKTRSGSAKKILVKDQSPFHYPRSPANFSLSLKKSKDPSPDTKHLEKTLRICQEKMSDISVALLDLYTILNERLKGDEEFDAEIKILTMNPALSNSLKSSDPIFTIEIIKKIAVNCLDFRESLQKLKCLQREQPKDSESKDFLMIIDSLEFKVQGLLKKEAEMKFYLGTMKNKVALLEKQNAVILATTNQMAQENAQELKKLVTLLKEKDVNLTNLEEILQLKKEKMAAFEDKLLSIPVLERKIEFMSEEFEHEKKKMNEEANKKCEAYQKLLWKEQNKSQSLIECNKSLNLGYNQGKIMNSQLRSLQNEILRMRKVVKEKDEKASLLNFRQNQRSILSHSSHVTILSRSLSNRRKSLAENSRTKNSASKWMNNE